MLKNNTLKLVYKRIAKSIIQIYNPDRKSPVKSDLVATEIENQKYFTLQ